MTALDLESFDPDAPHIKRPDPAYLAGFAEGEAAGRAAAEAQQGALRSELVQAIADLNFTFSEAKQDITQSLRPLFDQVLSTLLPQFTAIGFGAEIAALVQSHLQHALDGELTLTLHPSQIDPVAAALADFPATPALVADNTISHHAAWISAGGTTTFLNIDALLAEVSTILSAIHNDDDRTDSHG